MLVLTRQTGQKIKITCPDGTEIFVTMLGMTATQAAKIGIEAPTNFHIIRDNAKNTQRS